MEINVYKYRDVNLEGAILINGFPSSGLVGTIIANYLIGTLRLDQICALDSEDFPPISMIYASKPKFPARIYADEEAKIVVFLSEFTPLAGMARSIGKTILSFAKEYKCRCIISPEVIVGEGELGIFGVGSTDSAREELSKLEVKPFMHGMIAGISGVLLNEGRINGFDVAVLLALAPPETSDARVAAKITEVIDRFIPHLKIDVAPLYEEAERIEERIRALRRQAKSAEINTLYR